MRITLLLFMFKWKPRHINATAVTVCPFSVFLSQCYFALVFFFVLLLRRIYYNFLRATHDKQTRTQFLQITFMQMRETFQRYSLIRWLWPDSFLEIQIVTRTRFIIFARTNQIALCPLCVLVIIILFFISFFLGQQPKKPNDSHSQRSQTR